MSAGLRPAAPGAGLLDRDLDEVVEQAGPAWPRLRGCRIFMTGATRFFGAWLLESLLWANRRLALGAQAVVLSRDPEGFRERVPRLAGDPAVRLLKGDARSFAFPRGGFTHVIHGAAGMNVQRDAEDSLLTLETLQEGARRTLEFARRAGVQGYLYISSGAVYGPQPPTLRRLDEDYPGAPDSLDPRSTYGQGKRAAEHLCSLYHERFGVQTKIARAFSFVGPHLPIDRHNALGNFIRDGLGGGPIRVTGDGTPIRSYLYGSDLAAWLWTILTLGAPCRPYNVGSEADVSLAELASVAAAIFGTKVAVAKPGAAGRPADRYVPSTRRAFRELGLRERVSLPEALRRTVDWHRSRPCP